MRSPGALIFQPLSRPSIALHWLLKVGDIFIFIFTFYFLVREMNLKTLLKCLRQ